MCFVFAVIRSKNKKNFRKLLGLNVTCESFSGLVARRHLIKGTSERRSR